MGNQPAALKLDHIAVVARTLDAGIAHVQSQLGITVPKGGSHPTMGTHNCLTRIGPGEFLEVIAVDPDAQTPNRPRWFGLDDLRQDAALTVWVLGTGDIRALLPHAIPEAGEAITMTRGNLEWLIAVPPDGSLPMQGAFPTLIEWPHGPHPAENMTDMGCSLTSLIVRHPDIGRVEEFLTSRFPDPRISFETSSPAELIAEFDTPSGGRTLR